VYLNAGNWIHGHQFKDFSPIAAVVNYDPSLKPWGNHPELLHCAGPEAPTKLTEQDGYVSYHYPEANSGNFIIPDHHDFLSSSAAVAHTRTLIFFKKHLKGPIFDLEAIWEEHTDFEFGNRSVANTMGTMVQEPYVNHIPTVCKVLCSPILSMLTISR